MYIHTRLSNKKKTTGYQQYFTQQRRFRIVPPGFIRVCVPSAIYPRKSGSIIMTRNRSVTDGAKNLIKFAWIAKSIYIIILRE